MQVTGVYRSAELRLKLDHQRAELVSLRDGRIGVTICEINGPVVRLVTDHGRYLLRREGSALVGRRTVDRDVFPVTLPRVRDLSPARPVPACRAAPTDPGWAVPMAETQPALPQLGARIEALERGLAAVVGRLDRLA